jgi:mono/diheme cytochrome c family protein
MKWLLLTLPLVLAGCGGLRRPPGLSLVEPSTAVERAGAASYARHCHGCHPNAAAGLGPSPLFPPRFVVPLQVRLGLGAMPAFSHTELPPAELRALLTWLDAVEDRGAR